MLILEQDTESQIDPSMAASANSVWMCVWMCVCDWMNITGVIESFEMSADYVNIRVFNYLL